SQPPSGGISRNGPPGFYPDFFYEVLPDFPAPEEPRQSARYRGHVFGPWFPT
ncbi:hypothetical protein FIBSPDRAFT_858684, partial [Athelia psychrophila]